ncbi:Cytosolic iron-sulfur assembly component 2B [Coemansia spiralis]|nr:Cytosolic iron-sulfur assembly component 2B [Coemansia spiralis]
MAFNDAPLVYAVVSRARESSTSDMDDSVHDPIDAEEVYELIRGINDPEHPLTLEQLRVTNLEHVSVDDGAGRVLIEFTPTIPHCSMATLIGLCIRVRLLRSLPERFKVDIRVRQGTHQSEADVNKQLNDKERVAAALENTYLLDVVNQCLATAA